MVQNLSSTVPQLGQYESFYLLKPESRGPDTYIVTTQIKGNSLLSSVYVKALDPGATLKVNYYDYTYNEQVPERNDLTSHDLITSPQTEADRILLNRFHDRVVLEVIVSGGNVDFSVFASVITDPLIDISSDSFEGLVKYATDPLISNVPMVLAATEYSHTLQDETKIVILQSRLPNAKLQYSFVSGETNTKFKTIRFGNDERLSSLLFDSKTIYVRSSKPNNVLEVLEIK